MALSKSGQHFIDIMVPHHQAGIKMARDALPTSTDPRVTALLKHVIQDQGEEVKQMMDWEAELDSGSMMKTMADKPGLGEAGHPNPLHPDPAGGLAAMGKTGRGMPEPIERIFQPHEGGQRDHGEPEPVGDDELRRNPECPL